MKNLFLACIILVIAGGFTACQLDNVNPQTSMTTTTPTKSDTSVTLISNTTLVGNWNIVTDTIKDVSASQTVVYKGTPADHYIFTKYGNLYINSGYQNYVDTAVYTIGPNSKVEWANSYISVNGVSSRAPSSSGAFVIASVTTHSLVLTQDAITANGDERYESITFTK
jgi:hypothetical protein